MRPPAFAIPVLLLVASGSWAAGVDLSWNDCLLGSNTATANRNFSCLGAVNQQYSLVFQFSTAANMADFSALTVFADVAAQAPGNLVPFWHYELGCNAGGISVNDAILATCQANGYLDAWGGDGSAGTAAIVAYGPDYARPGDGRMVVLVYRTDSYPIQAGMHYYGFDLVFKNLNRHTCFGCTQLAVVIAETAVLESIDGTHTIELSGADKGTDCVGINGASPGLCGALPVDNMTWGRLKSLYR